MLPKRSVAEIIFIAKTEGAINDVYCEGQLDRQVISAFSAHIGKNATLVCAAEQIEWPEEVGTYGGHRGRILYLSGKLASEGLRGTCVIDRDLDTIENTTEGNANLVKTDYSCMEMYGLLSDDLKAYLSATYNAAISDLVLKSVFEACRQLFVIRYLREKYCVGASLPKPNEIVELVENSVIILTDVYLDRCRQVNGYDPRWDKVSAEFKAVLSQLGAENRDYIHIHDMGSIMEKIIRKIKKGVVALEFHFLEKHCVYVIISRALYSDPIFKAIEARLK